jgi:flagellar assembly protein FliH
MKNFSSSKLTGTAVSIPIKSFTYRDICDQAETSADETDHAGRAGEQKGDRKAEPGPSAQEINDLLVRARAEGAAESEGRLRAEYESRSQREAGKIREALDNFRAERKNYFSRVESDVVHLALSIAAKILHREAQVDPLLVAALVRVAVEKLHDGSSVSVRICPASAEKWRDSLASPLNGSSIAIIEDAHLEPEECILETDLGSANFSIDAQLKEVEQGFFDLLAQRPTIK